jgi:hypothetical protein
MTARKLDITRKAHGSLQVLSIYRHFIRVFTPEETQELCEALQRLFPEHFPELGEENGRI